MTRDCRDNADPKVNSRGGTDWEYIFSREVHRSLYKNSIEMSVPWQSKVVRFYNALLGPCGAEIAVFRDKLGQ